MNKRKGGLHHIIIGIAIAIFGASIPNRDVFLIVGGIVWAICGVCLFIKNQKDVDRDIEETLKEIREARIEPSDDEEL